MPKTYMNFRGREGVETLWEYDPTELSPATIETERRALEQRIGRPVRSMTAGHAQRLISRRDLASANAQTPGHYISTRCTKEWRAK